MRQNIFIFLGVATFALLLGVRFILRLVSEKYFNIGFALIFCQIFLFFWLIFLLGPEPVDWTSAFVGCVVGFFGSLLSHCFAVIEDLRISKTRSVYRPHGRILQIAKIAFSTILVCTLTWFLLLHPTKEWYTLLFGAATGVMFAQLIHEVSLIWEAEVK